MSNLGFHSSKPSSSSRSSYDAMDGPRPQKAGMAMMGNGSQYQPFSQMGPASPFPAASGMVDDGPRPQMGTKKGQAGAEFLPFQQYVQPPQNPQQQRRPQQQQQQPRTNQGNQGNQANQGNQGNQRNFNQQQPQFQNQFQQPQQQQFQQAPQFSGQESVAVNGANGGAAPTPRELLRQLKQEAEKAKDYNSKVRAASQAEEARKTQSKMDDLEAKLVNMEESIKEICDSLTQVFSQLTELSLQTVGGNSSDSQGGGRAASQSDLDEITKIVTTHVETISSMTQRVDTLESKVSTFSNTSSGGQDITVLKNASKAMALAEEAKRIAQESDDRSKLHESVMSGKMDVLSDRLTSVQTTFIEKEKTDLTMREQIQKSLKSLYETTYWMYGRVQKDCIVYSRIPTLTDSDLRSLKQDQILAGNYILMVNPAEEGETGMWIKTRSVNDSGDFSQGWVPLSTSDRYLQADMSKEHTDELDWHSVIGEFSTFVEPKDSTSDSETHEDTETGTDAES